MSQKTEKGKANPEFESPDGVRIQINRGGNKMQFVRDLCRNKKITPIQFRILVPLVDTSNEGTDNDRSRWGKSWLSLENLAKESGCSKRAVEKNLPKLEAAGIVKIWRDLDGNGRPTGGKSNVNEYWLYGWNTFGAVLDEENSEQRSPFENGNSERGTEKQRTADRGTANAGPENSEQHSPDSTYPPHSETPPTTPSAPASSDRGPAADDQSHVVSGAAKIRLAAGNDNQPTKDDDTAQYRKAAEDIWKMFRKAPPSVHDEFVRLFVELAKAGEIKSSEEVRYGLRCHLSDTPETRYQKNPVKFLSERHWRTYREETPEERHRRSRAKCNVAI